MKNIEELFSPEEQTKIHPDTLAVLKSYPWTYIPVEGALYYSNWVSKEKLPDGSPMGTSILAMYCEHPYSASCFHKLDYDEIWHFYSGDPLRLYLLHPDGSSEIVIMGSNVAAGEKVQFVIPSGTWQAGEILPGGRYSLFGCTLAPGFTGDIFEGGIAEKLISLYPDREEEIKRLNMNNIQTQMPPGYAQ